MEIIYVNRVTKSALASVVVLVREIAPRADTSGMDRSAWPSVQFQNTVKTASANLATKIA